MTDLYHLESNVISTMSQLRFFPQTIVGGKGSYVEADDGRKLLDFTASWSAASLGYGHPALVRAVCAAAANPAGASYLSTVSKPSVDLAEKLLSIVPERAQGRVWIGHSGSDANETVVRMVLAATGRPRLLAFQGGYHGGTIGSMSVSGHPALGHVQKLPGLSLVPYCGMNMKGDEAAATDTLASIEHLLSTTIPPHEVAAFFIEPIQGDGGLIVPPANFLKGIQRLCREHSILLVCDEVKFGLGRTGLLHAFQHSEVEPDIIVFGKGLGGGLPISAIVGPTSIMNHAAAFSYQTLHGNPICASAALAVLETIESEDLVRHAAILGERMLQTLKSRLAKFDFVSDVRGKGLAIGVELAGLTGGHSAKQFTALTTYRAFELGLVIYYVGIHSNVIEITPPLSLRDSEADAGIEIIVQALNDVAAGKVSPEKVAPFAGW